MKPMSWKQDPTTDDDIMKGLKEEWVKKLKEEVEMHIQVQWIVSFRERVLAVLSHPALRN